MNLRKRSQQRKKSNRSEKFVLRFFSVNLKLKQDVNKFYWDVQVSGTYLQPAQSKDYCVEMEYCTSYPAVADESRS
jgi:hypothetical protein